MKNVKYYIIGHRITPKESFKNVFIAPYWLFGKYRNGCYNPKGRRMEHFYCLGRAEKHLARLTTNDTIYSITTIPIE